MREQSPDRISRARNAALTRWSYEDPVAGTAAARQAFLDSFEAKVDPEGKLPPAERARRAERLRRVHFSEMAKKSAAARRRKRDAA